MVQLHLKASHRQILSTVVLFLLVIAVGDPGKVMEGPWWPAVGACALIVVVAVAAFYFVLAFSNIVFLKESYFGASFFGWHFDRSKSMRLTVAIGVALTYFAFLCRVWIMSGVEAFFVATIIVRIAGIRMNPAWIGCWLFPLVIVIALIHTWAERSRLGKAALAIQEKK